eukprot:719490-Hanusia_phi.AAC.9
MQGHVAASLNLDPSKDSVPTYNPARDPWLRAGKGSYQLWADDFALKHGDGKQYGKGYGSHGMYTVDEEPNRLNKKNGWERAEFQHWVKHQGGPSSDFWEKKGFPTVGSQYTHALKRLGINSFDDLKDFNVEYDVPSYECGETGLISSHKDCGMLKEMVTEAEGDTVPDFWYSSNRGNLTSEGIQQHMKSVSQEVENMLPTLSGRRPWDDRRFYCYSKFPSDPEFSQCMSDIDFATDPVTGDGKKDKPWSALTRGLWTRHADGLLADGSDDLLGQSWKQLTSGLWREKPYMERNGMDY